MKEWEGISWNFQFLGRLNGNKLVMVIIKYEISNDLELIDSNREWMSIDEAAWVHAWIRATSIIFGGKHWV